MQPPPGLSPDDVAYLVNLHSGLIGVPVALHAALCSKLVNGVLDAGASFYIEENEESRRQTHALVELSVEGDVWICEHAASFSTREELLHLVRQEGDVINDSGENSAAARPLHAVAALAPEAGAAAVTDALLHGHSHLLPAASGGDAGSHFICSDFAGAFGAADLSTAPSCCSVAIFSPLHGRHFSVVWVTTALKQNEACTVRRDDGCYFPNAKGGNAHLHRVSSPHYRTLFHLDRGSVKPVAANTTQLTNLSPDPLRPVLLCADFLQPHELEYLRGLVYDGEEGSFGTQFIKGVATTKEAAPPSSEKVHDPELAHELDADTMALVAAVLGERNPAGSSGESGATKNRLRTSHFLRTVWWRSDQGRLIFEAISARAGALLGLPAACAEAPQMVCYPGGLSYFRPHHDSGRLLDDDQQDYSCSEAGSSSSDNESSGTESSSRGAWVNLDRDHHGAARVATVFVYLSSHEPGSGGSTTFSRLQQPTDAAAETTAAKEAAAAAATLVDALKVALVAAKDANSTATAAMLVTALAEGEAEATRTARLLELAVATAAAAAPVTAPPLRVAPVAGAAALWSNVDGAGRPDPCMVHEAEALEYPSMVSMEAALADKTLPMKIGLNLWFTDRDPYPRPEMKSGGAGMAYSAQDLQAGASSNKDTSDSCSDSSDSSDGD